MDDLHRSGMIREALADQERGTPLPEALARYGLHGVSAGEIEAARRMAQEMRLYRSKPSPIGSAIGGY